MLPVLPVTWASSGMLEAVENQKGERWDWDLKVGCVEVSLGVRGEMIGSPSACSSPSAVMSASWGREVDLSSNNQETICPSLLR